MGRGKNENQKDKNIQHTTKQWYRNAFSGPKLENKKKHRNIMNEILWICGIWLMRDKVPAKVEPRVQKFTSTGPWQKEKAEQSPRTLLLTGDPLRELHKIH